ncbi:MAG: hypothetical protein ACJ77D_08350 [Chloroflexota bacterium]
MITARLARLVLALLVAVGALAGALPGTAPRDVRAATPDLTIVSDAHYDVQPAQHRVRVTLDLTLTNRLHDTTTRRYFFDHAFLAVLPGATGYSASWGGRGRPTVSVARRTASYTLLRLNLARDLSSGKTARYRLRFDLRDPGGKATRDLRIGDTLVSFPVWAFASDSTPGSSVTVVFPKGYQIAVEAGHIAAPATLTDGRTVFRTGPLSAPLDFFAYLVGDRPGAYRDTTITPTVVGRQVAVTVRAWSDDVTWGQRVRRLLATGLPALSERIGLEWPDYDKPLVVSEAVSRSTGGYAGIFDPSAGEVAIAYYADDFVVLHEAAHTWFNGSLLADRWSNEAFASYYAALAAGDLKLKVTADRLTPALQKARIPLNEWGAVGTLPVPQEDYGYAAGLALAREIAKRAGDRGLRDVWADAADRISAYQPSAGGEEVVAGAVDWRGLLDLLEEHTGVSYDDLWRTWVARPSDLPLLDARLAARTKYLAFVSAVRDWQVPLSIRDAMRAWRFDKATELMDAATSVLDLRAKVEKAAADAGLAPPVALREAFEDDDGFDDAIAEGGAELQAIDHYVTAVSKRPAEMTAMMELGLIGQAPDVDLTTARAAFARGDLGASAEASDQAAASWVDAEPSGQGRAFSIATIVIALLFFIGLVIVGFRRGRRRRRKMQATRLRT